MSSKTSCSSLQVRVPFPMLLLKACLTRPIILSNCPPHHGALVRLNCHLMFSLGRKYEVIHLLHHISQPLCCNHKRSTVIQVNLFWAAFPCDESLQRTDKLFCLHGFRQFEVRGTGQAASIKDYVGFSLCVSAKTVLHWTCIVNTDDLKGRSWRGLEYATA